MENSEKKNLEEEQYLSLIREILEKGEKRDDRTGVGTLAIFGARMKFSLRDNIIPLLTTKKVAFRAVAEELLWFMRGETDAKLLSARGVKIWDANGSRSFLDQRGLTDRREGDLGPIYGFQWRHAGAEYCGETKKDGLPRDISGIDQLADLIRGLRENPTSRRHIISAWNVVDLPKMALPPCHAFCQFYVSSHGELSCQLYQRSGDMGLGVPFNIASYALLTHILARICDLKPGDLLHILGDTHIYVNHIDALHVQLSRQPRAFPTIKLSEKIKTLADIDAGQVTSDDFDIIGYNPHPPIKMDMAV